jgi:hypothetical protein
LAHRQALAAPIGACKTSTKDLACLHAVEAGNSREGGRANPTLI